MSRSLTTDLFLDRETLKAQERIVKGTKTWQTQKERKGSVAHAQRGIACRKMLNGDFTHLRYVLLVRAVEVNGCGLAFRFVLYL